MNKTAAAIGLVLTLVSIIAGAAMAWQKLTDRVDQLEQRDHYEHGRYALPSQEP